MPTIKEAGIGLGQRKDHCRAREIIIIIIWFCDAVDIDLDHFALSTGLIMCIGHRKEMLKLTFGAYTGSICSDEGLTLETSALESLYDGQFTLSTQKPNYLVILPTDAAPQFLWKLHS